MTGENKKYYNSSNVLVDNTSYAIGGRVISTSGGSLINTIDFNIL